MNDPLSAVSRAAAARQRVTVLRGQIASLLAQIARDEAYATELEQETA